MANTRCYAMVRGSAIRVTALGSQGQITSPVRYTVSKAVAKVQVDEVTETRSGEVLRSEDVDNTHRIGLSAKTQTVGYQTSINFLGVDPAILNMVAGVPVVTKDGVAVGFDSTARLPAKGFALEVWTQLAKSIEPAPVLGSGFGLGGFGLGPFGIGGSAATLGFDQLGYGEGPFGGVEISELAETKFYGYTLFPFLKGGYLDGFTFANGLVTFNLINAQTRQMPRWSVGPFDLEGKHKRLLDPVTTGTLFRTQQVSTTPPDPTDGVVEFMDVIEGGTADETTNDTIYGGAATDSDPWRIEGGRAS